MDQWGDEDTEVGEIMGSFHDSVMFAMTGRMSTGSPQAVVHRRAASVGHDRGALHMDDLRAELTKHAWSASGVGIHPSAAAVLSETTALPFRAEWRAAGAREQPREEPANENGQDDVSPGETSAEREKSQVVEAELSRKLSACEEELRASQVLAVPQLGSPTFPRLTVCFCGTDLTILESGKEHMLNISVCPNRLRQSSKKRDQMCLGASSSESS